MEIVESILYVIGLIGLTSISIFGVKGMRKCIDNYNYISAIIPITWITGCAYGVMYITCMSLS